MNKKSILLVVAMLWQQPLLALQEMRLSITEKNRQAM